jgi:hypothetical protein
MTAQATNLEQVGQRIYFRNAPFAAKDAIKAIGSKWDGDQRSWWIGTSKKAEAEKLVAVLNDPNAAPVQASPDSIRLSGKGEYKGRSYYVGARSQDGSRMRLYTLPDAAGKYLEFWADSAAVRVTKEYRPREVWDGRRNSGKTQMVYTTLGGIAKFIADQRREEQAGTPECPACGKRTELIHDLEDGLMKCRGCCDMPE